MPDHTWKAVAAVKEMLDRKIDPARLVNLHWRIKKSRQMIVFFDL